MVDRTTTLLPLCSYFTPVGSYSLKLLFARPVQEDRARAAVPRRISRSRPTPARARRNDRTKHRRHRPGRGRPVGGARGGRSGARERHRRRHHADRQGTRGRRRRQHPLDAVLHADGRRSIASSRRSSTTCWRRRGSRATRTISPRSPQQAPATVKWIAAHGVPFHQPVYYLAKGPPRIQPVGGGETIHRELTRAAREAGVVVPLRLRRRCADRRAMARSRASASPPARRCPPMPSSSPAAASRPMPR